jgi:hypothetical protein
MRHSDDDTVMMMRIETLMLKDIQLHFNALVHGLIW